MHGGHVLGIDFSPEMLRGGRGPASDPTPSIDLGDATNLETVESTESYDAATIAYGAQERTGPGRALLRDGAGASGFLEGRVVCLEIARPHR